MRRGEANEREKKIGVLRSARKLVISWNEIFFSLREAIGHALPAIHPFVRRNDRWIGNFEAPNHPRDRPTCFSLSLSSRWISCYERQRRFTIIIFPVNYSDSLRGGEEDARVCVCTCTMYNVGIYLNVSLKSGNIPKYTFYK